MDIHDRFAAFLCWTVTAAIVVSCTWESALPLGAWIGGFFLHLFTKPRPLGNR